MVFGHIHYSAGKQFGSYMPEDCVSMSTNNSQYIENRQFQPPVQFTAVETIINPAAERETLYDGDCDHNYHEPFEMNAARALPLIPRPLTPRPTTITNVHYGVPGGNGFMGSTMPPEYTPHYQDPEELSSVSLWDSIGKHATGYGVAWGQLEP